MKVERLIEASRLESWYPHLDRQTYYLGEVLLLKGILRVNQILFPRIVSMLFLAMSFFKIKIIIYGFMSTLMFTGTF